MVKKNAQKHHGKKIQSSKLSFWDSPLASSARSLACVSASGQRKKRHVSKRQQETKGQLKLQCQETTAVRWQNLIPSSSERHQVGEKTCTGRLQNHLAKDPAATKMSDTKTENHLKHREITDLANHLKRHPAKIWDKWKSEDIAKQPSQDI